MAILRYPIPYQIMAAPVGSRKPRPMEVADTALFEIPDGDDANAPVVAVIDKPWPLGVFQANSYQARNNLRPPERLITEVREYEGNFYSAVVIANGNGHQLARVEDFALVMGGGRSMATSFAHLYAMRDNGTINRLVLQHSGRMQRLEDMEIVNRSPALEEHVVNRDVVLENAARDATYYIAVDGYLWHKMPEEPKLRYDIVSNSLINITMNKGSMSIEGKSGYFRLTRMTEMLEFLKDNYPAHKIASEVSSLDVTIPEAFTFDDESHMMWQLAWEVFRKTDSLVPEMPVDTIAGHWFDLRDEVVALQRTQSPEGKGELLASLVAPIIDHFPDLPNAENLKARLERWEMRPLGTGLSASV